VDLEEMLYLCHVLRLLNLSCLEGMIIN